MAHNMLCLDQVDELRILRPIDVCAERDVVDRQPAWYDATLHRLDFFRLIDDILALEHESRVLRTYWRTMARRLKGFTRANEGEEIHCIGNIIQK